MRNIVLVAYTTIREVKTLTRDVAVRVRGIIGSQPAEEREKPEGVKGTDHRGKATGGKRRDSPCLYENLLRPIRSACRRCSPNIGCHLLQRIVRSMVDPTVGSCCAHCLRHATEHLRVGTVHHGINKTVRVGGVVDDVLRLARRRVHTLGVSGVRGRGETGTDVALAKVTLEGRV